MVRSKDENELIIFRKKLAVGDSLHIVHVIDERRKMMKKNTLTVRSLL
jgi:hypothetical protein